MVNRMAKMCSQRRSCQNRANRGNENSIYIVFTMIQLHPIRRYGVVGENCGKMGRVNNYEYKNKKLDTVTRIRLKNKYEKAIDFLNSYPDEKA